MKHEKIKYLIFMALCCDLGIFAKKLIVPAANIITDSLHIPGGIGTAFSMMFIVVAAVFVPRFGSATIMGAVQSGIALCMGTVGSMGALAPLGYVVPGIVIDCALFMSRRLRLPLEESLVLANALASVSACLVANLIVFRLNGVVFALYVCVAAFSGTVCGMLANCIAQKLKPIFGEEKSHEKKYSVDTLPASDCDDDICNYASDNAHAKC